MKCTLALILLIGVTAAANADAWTWYSVESEPVAAAADKGLVLDILRPAAGGTQTLTVHQWVEVDAPMQLSGASSDFNYGDDSGVFTVNDYSVDVGEGLYGHWLVQDLPEVDATGVSGYGGVYFMGPPTESYITSDSGVQHVASFDLTINWNNMTQSSHSMLGGIGYNVWAQASGALFDVHYGEGVMENMDTLATANVVRAVLPEPTTIVLLGFGALALIRRR